MTAKEAIDVLFNEWKCIDRNDGIHCDRKCETCDLVMDVGIIREAFNMAISALEAQELSKNSPELDKENGDLQPTCNQLAKDICAPCKDTISRQAAVDAIGKCTDIYVNNLPTMVDKAEVYKALNEVPPAEQIVRCKDCQHFRTYYHGTESDPVITHACVWFLDREMGLEDYCSKGVIR